MDTNMETSLDYEDQGKVYIYQSIYVHQCLAVHLICISACLYIYRSIYLRVYILCFYANSFQC